MAQQYKTPNELIEKEYKDLSDEAIGLFGKGKRLSPEKQSRYNEVKNKMSEMAKKNAEDYELFNSIYYTPDKYGRPNYVEGEQEKIWNELSKHFDLPKYEPHKYGFTVNDKDKIVNLMINGVQDGSGFGGWKVKPQHLGQIKRRIK